MGISASYRYTKRLKTCDRIRSLPMAMGHLSPLVPLSRGGLLLLDADFSGVSGASPPSVPSPSCHRRRPGGRTHEAGLACSTKFLVLRSIDGRSVVFLVPYLLSEPVQIVFASSQEGGHHRRFGEETLVTVPESLLQSRDECPPSWRRTRPSRSWRGQSRSSWPPPIPRYPPSRSQSGVRQLRARSVVASAEPFGHG